jgi:hypothetical protein
LARYKDSRAKEILDLGNHLFDKRKPLDSLLQDIAWQFAPDLAEFMAPLDLGEDWGADRMDSFPQQAYAELCSQLGIMLRPYNKQWFTSSTGDNELDRDEATAQFNEYVSGVMRREMYRAKTGFIAAAKDWDRQYVGFGQGVLSIEESPVDREHLFFRNHHIKDVVWLNNQLQQVDHLHRRESMSARQMVRTFGENRLHESIGRAARKEPNREFPIRYVSMPGDEYDDFAEDTAKNGNSKRRNLDFVNCCIDVENCRMIKDGGSPVFNYIVSRWHRLSNTQYAFSPATMTALPDGRMAQMLSQILLESGEKAIDPPMVGKQEAVIGEPNIAAGGISWVDLDHDTKLSDALDILKIDADMRVGFQMRVDVREMLSKAFFLDKLRLPETGAKEMTAFEVARRLEEHIRDLLPLFEPAQVEHSRMLDTVFNLLVTMKKIDFSRMPDSMSEVDTIWEFDTPITGMESRLLVEQFLDTANVVAVAKESEPAIAVPLHFNRALRDAIRGVGGPASWRMTQEEQDEAAAANEEQMGMDSAIQQIGAGGMAAEQVGKAGQALGMIAPPGKGAPAGGAPAEGGGAAPPPGPAPSGAMPLPSAAPASGPGGGGPAMQGGADISGLIAALGAGAAAGGGQPAPVQSSGGNTSEMLLRRILNELAALNETMQQPRKISLEKGKDGKLSGATATAGKGKFIEGARA